MRHYLLQYAVDITIKGWGYAALEDQGDRVEGLWVIALKE